MGQVGRLLSSSVPASSGSRHSTSESVSAAKSTALCLTGPYCCFCVAASPPLHNGGLSTAVLQWSALASVYDKAYTTLHYTTLHYTTLHYTTALTPGGDAMPTT